MKQERFAVGAAGACMLGAAASGAVTYSNTLQNGPAPGWATTNGAFAWTSQGLESATLAENRIFLSNATNGQEEFTVSFDAALTAGSGWSFFFKTAITNTDDATGYSFNYEPGFGSGAYLVKKWTDDAQDQLAAVFAPLDETVFHRFDLTVTAGSLVVARDGETIVNFVGDVSRRGDLLGFRTWYNGEATLRNLVVQAVPAPGAGAMLGALSGTLALRRRRR